MGLGFEVTSTPWKRRLWAKPSAPALQKEIARIYAAHLGDASLARRLEVALQDELVVARWHPAEDGLRLELLEDGRIHADAATNTVGPGYHAHLISLLDRVASELGIAWAWGGEDDGDETGFDETGYATSRDPVALQEAMLDWLRAIGRVVLEEDSRGGEDLGVSMPIDFPRPKHTGVLVYSSMGTWTRDRFERAIESEEALRALALDFFPWWSGGMDARFWRGLATVLAWCELPWVSPRGEGERASAAFAKTCFERARALDPSVALPERELEELAMLLDGARSVGTPRKDGIGHRRVVSTFPLLGGWTVELPGHFEKHVLEGGRNLQLEDGSRAVFVSAFAVGGEKGTPTAREMISRANQGPADFEWAAGHILGEARWAVEDRSRHLFASVATDGKLLLLTITDDVAASRDWAESVARSVRHPRP